MENLPTIKFEEEGSFGEGRPYSLSVFIEYNGERSHVVTNRLNDESSMQKMAEEIVRKLDQIKISGKVIIDPTSGNRLLSSEGIEYRLKESLKKDSSREYELMDLCIERR